MKTIIPAKARAILSARLVPDQDPLDIRRLIQSHLESRCPEGARLTFHDVIETGALAFRSSVNAPVVQAAARAYRETCGSCEFVLEGWSVPVIAELTKILDLAPNTALIGYGLSTDAIHAPNEHFSIERLRRGFVTMARLLCILGEHPFRN